MMKTPSIALLLSALLSGNAVAECQDWVSFDTHDEVDYRWCTGRFEYAGGDVAMYIQFRNNGSRVANVSCDIDVVKSDGTSGRTSFYATIRPGEINRNGGNYTIGETTRNGKCSVKYS